MSDEQSSQAQQQQQPPPAQHYAFVSPSQPLELPQDDHGTQEQQQRRQHQHQQQPQELLVELYQSYAERYPNPRLIEEYQERDQLLQATSAAHSANALHRRTSNKKQKKKGWFGSLFGGGSKEDDSDQQKQGGAAHAHPFTEISPEEDQWLEYTEELQEDDDGTLCGTNHSLDRSCIPPEAHSMARLSLVSARTRQERPLIVRASPHLPSEQAFVIVGLGRIAEFQQQQQPPPRNFNDNDNDVQAPSSSQCQNTLDREDLVEYASTRGGFDLLRVRAASLGPHFMVISWGFSDGIVVFYRRIHLKNGTTAWEPAVFLGPSSAVLEHSYDAYVDEEDEHANSALLRITDIVPLVVTTPGIPAAALAVSRLGGYLEVLPVPPPLWYGPPLTPEKHKPRGRKKRSRSNSSPHYAKPHLVDIASEQAPIPILALTTMEYHLDTLCLEAIRTRVTMDTVWDQEFYGKAPPPAEYVLVASGTQNGHEILTFWSISYMFAEEPPTDGSAGFTLHAVLQEALDVGPVGANLSIFANRAILNQWRQPRKVSLKEQQPAAPSSLNENGEDEHEGEDATTLLEEDKIIEDNPKPPSVYDRVTTITVSAPIVAMQNITVPATDNTPQMVLLSLLDWNGSVTIMDCSFLERMVSHSLWEEEYRAVHDADMAAEQEEEGQEPPSVPALVKTLVDRSLMMQWMKASYTTSKGLLYQCVNVQWLARADNQADPWLILLAAPQHPFVDKSRIMILSGFLGDPANLENPPVQTVTFPTARAALQGNTLPVITEDWAALSSSLLRIVFPPRKQAHKLCICLLQPLESQDILASLARDRKYKQALEAAQELNFEAQQQVKTTLEECRQKLWEQSGDINWLRQVTDDAYVLRQALSLFETEIIGREEEHIGENGISDGSTAHLDNIDIDMCRDICSLALQRVPQLRLGSALVLGYGTEDARAKLQGMLVRLGTYELLCQSLNAEPLFPRFRQMFLQISVVELAKSFANVADLAAMSILCFRHAVELRPQMIDNLSRLPMTLDPLSICHLLPISRKLKEQDTDRSDLFMTNTRSKEGNELLHISQLPSYLKGTMALKIVLNGDDEKMVLEHISSSGGVQPDKNEDELLSFYVSRAKEMQNFSGNLRHVSDFCALGLLAAGTPVVHLDEAELDSSTRDPDSGIWFLYQTWGCAISLQRMLVESAGDAPMEGEEGGLYDLEPFVTVTPLDLASMELVNIVKMVLGGQDDPDVIYETYNEYLLPLLKFLPDESYNDLDGAIKAYCIATIRTSVFDYAEIEEEGAVEDEDIVVDHKEDGVLKALQICKAIAFGSRTTVKKTDRIVKEKKVLINLVLTAIYEISLRCESASMPRNVCHTIVKLMWDMYETMPVGAVEEVGSDEGMSELLAQADNVFQDLVGADILSRWPGCHAQGFSFLISRTRARDESGVGGEEDAETRSGIVGQQALASMCRSFCSQAADRKGAIGLSSLLRDLTSDIEQLYQVCYDRDDSFHSVLVDVLSSELIAPLFRQTEFELLTQFLTGADETWWDKEHEARAIRSYVDGIVFAEERLPTSAGSDEDSSLQSAIACQDALGPIFPDLQAEFQSVRRYLDAAHFINTVIFAELHMPKPIRPNDLRGDLPLDVIESILKALPKAIVLGCKEWGEAALAVHANKALRQFQDTLAQSANDPKPSNLPPLPGGAVFHLAGILGLEDTASVLVVKSRVVHYGVSSGLHGASAAVCRTMLYDNNAFSSSADSVARLAAVAEVVTQDDFDDLATKKELCVAALRKYQYDLAVENCKPFDAILKVYTALEPKTSQAQNGVSKDHILGIPSPSDSMGCLYKDTWAQYSVNICDLFGTLQQHTSSFSLDDSLLNALSRYVFFCCIFRSTRPRTEHPGKLEKATSNQLLVLGAALLLHIEDRSSISIPAVKELRQILEKQAMAVINQHPTAFEDLVTVPNEDIVQQLIGRGFTPMSARRSALATKNVGVQQALQWGVANARDPRMNDPIIFVSTKRNIFVDKMSIQQIMNTFAFTGQFLSGAKTPQEWLQEHSIFTTTEEPMKPPAHFAAGKSSDGKDSQPLATDAFSPKNEKYSEASSQPAIVKANRPQAEAMLQQEDTATKPISQPPHQSKEASYTPKVPPPPKEKPPSKPYIQAPVPPPPKPIPTLTQSPPRPAQKAQPKPGAQAPAVYFESTSPGREARVTSVAPSSATTAKPDASIRATHQSTQPQASSPAVPGPGSIPRQADVSSELPQGHGQMPSSRPEPIASGLSVETASPVASGNSFKTPTNRPPSLQLGGSTGSSTSSDYEALKKRGQSEMQTKRSTPRHREQTREERKRLIEAGRRLLAKSRTSNPVTSKGAGSPSQRASSGYSSGPTFQSQPKLSSPGPLTMQSPGLAPKPTAPTPPAAPPLPTGTETTPPPPPRPPAPSVASTPSGTLGAATGQRGDVGTHYGGTPVNASDGEHIAEGISSTALSQTTSSNTNGNAQIEKLALDDDDDGWDFEDF